MYLCMHCTGTVIYLGWCVLVVSEWVVLVPFASNITYSRAMRGWMLGEVCVKCGGGSSLYGFLSILKRRGWIARMH
jgi:hypothetical protein